MGFDIQVQTHDISGNEDRRWLATRKGYDTARPITLDVSAFSAAHIAAKGAIPSGTVLAKITATGLYGPYSGKTEETNTIAIAATGGTFTITYAGQTTAAIAWNASAATVLAALVALSNVASGDLTVTLAGTTYTITATDSGAFANTDVTVTTSAASLTGGAGTATVATTQAGAVDGAGGLEVARGFLFNTTRVGGPYNLGSDTALATAGDVGTAMVWEGVINTALLPDFVGTSVGQLDADARTDLPNFRFE